MLLTKESVSRRDWANFFNAQNIDKRFTSVYAIAYVSAVDKSQADNLVNQLNANRLPAEKDLIKIYPASNSDQLTVLTYIAPESADQGLIGYDLSTNSARLQTLAAARDSGLLRVSEPLSLMNSQKI